ncbi:MAG: ribosome biogenesis GTP-binding protein YihA/YsxC [Desulfobacterales bacterium]|nr:ribosome biogenesis GTP-binding protein YihA/YsxC [Desulfobacterales bacterium]
MNIQSAEFIKSAVKPTEYPPPQLPEIAFAGRSNVGKSSLINTLVNRKRLVKTSNTPGRTRLLNFFAVNGRIGFVDLPGYGYAKVPETVRQRWGPMVEAYLSERGCLRGVVLLIDLRRDPGSEEINLLHWLADRTLPVRIVLTKADKLSKSRQKLRRQKIAAALRISASELILFSAKTRAGRDDLWREILSMADEAQP